MRTKAQKSTSAETRAEAHRFAASEVRNIERIIGQLRSNGFRFPPAKGVLIAKAGKKAKRPVVIAPVESRIVQRALLDLVQEQPSISARLKSGFNFGGVEGPGFGVKNAVAKAMAVAAEKPYYIRTDIKSFFTKVPREQALERILSVIVDPSLRQLLKQATETELSDVERLGEDIKLFPIHEEGVAQGSCLSPLLCNLLLADFDEAMNDRGVVCIRYIDDFILFAKGEREAFKALKSAKAMLHKLGLDVYDPSSGTDEEKRKADHGPVAKGFDFLGCTVIGNVIQPSRKNRERLRESVKRIFDEALGAMSDPTTAALARGTYAEAIRSAGLVIRGWGNSHSFCTDSRVMKEEDGNLGVLFDDFNTRVKKKASSLNSQDRRRILGMYLLQDCNVEVAIL